MKHLGIFIPLIVTNCAIIGRAEAYASKNPVKYAAFDGLMMGLGFTLVLMLLGAMREALGYGTLFSGADLLFGQWAERNGNHPVRNPKSVSPCHLTARRVSWNGSCSLPLKTRLNNRVEAMIESSLKRTRLLLVPESQQKVDCKIDRNNKVAQSIGQK